MKVVVYLRVSTDRQADHGLGLDVQHQAVKAWAATHGHRLTARFTDAGASGTRDLPDRPGLAAALSEIREGSAEGVVVYRLDRLAGDLILQEQLLAEIKRLGGSLFSTSPSEQDYLRDDAADLSRRLIRQVLGAVSEYERSMIRLRLLSGQRRKAESGGYAGGAPPMGLRAEGRSLQQHQDEALVVLKARELREQGLSLRQVAQALDAAGHRPKRGRSWHPESLRRTLARESSPLGHEAPLAAATAAQGRHGVSDATWDEVEAELAATTTEPPSVDADGTPISAAELAAAGVQYWGEGHDPLGPEEWMTLKYQIALDRKFDDGGSQP